MVPRSWMAQLPLNKALPGSTFLPYGLYKVISYVYRHDMVDTKAPGFGVFLAVTRFIDKLR